MFLQNVVFLVTPGFAKWLEGDEAFLAAALQHIYENFTYHDNMRSIQSSVAVVDRLPSPAGVPDHVEAVSSNGQPKPVTGHEGIALWIDSMRFEFDKLPPVPNDDLVQRLVRVILMRRLGGGTAVELRPANTLFVNGHHSTMFQHSWHINPFLGPKLKQTGGRQQLKTLEIFDEADAPSFSAPMEALTERREVLSSMGNVIRQVKSQKDGTPVPASSELEKKVPQYLARRRGTDGVLAVFALVLPRQMLGRPLGDGLIQPSEGSATEADLSLLRRALLEGAHLHRVTSGGGGWGKKQGLLSLDPAFDFTKQEDTGSLDALLYQEGSGSRANFMNAVSPGDFVQFFASYEQGQGAAQTDDLANIQDINTSGWDAVQWAESDRLQTLLGALPSQDDFLASSQGRGLGESKIIGIPGYFGMLSAGGTCLRRYTFDGSDPQADLHADENHGGRKEPRQVALSRMDVPYGSWHVQSINQRLSPSVRHARITASSEEQQT